MRVLVIDNYDSFVYNLVQYIGEVAEVDVVRNDEEINVNGYSGIVISPGPGHPRNIPKVLNLIEMYSKDIPILGVCLGHQAISLTFGGNVKRADRVIHGKTSL
ncbi:MAG: anthranilate synthase component II, partial [Candidatus Methanofastidiosia archaeon]